MELTVLEKIARELSVFEHVREYEEESLDIKSPEYDEEEAEEMGFNDIPRGLTVEDVQEIYKRLLTEGKICFDLGGEYGVPFMTITFILMGMRGRKYTKHLWYLDDIARKKHDRLVALNQKIEEEYERICKEFEDEVNNHDNRQD